ncbi:hypothetical protein C5E45_12150 [Nocardia nova]|uniref:Uncharacterized protein n=1 Tax=Nocardia nova TaxID=37330 RepID=A0A2S6ARY4_9NOCA|nr:hypothetical protein [Nocardia nova]PPJ29537.1 hypothetical protein C5E41_11150 [Nocardia nova]PPJ37974.1 hypothetical protein C5E45_12150 [Nocardia nova]
MVVCRDSAESVAAFQSPQTDAFYVVDVAEIPAAPDESIDTGRVIGRSVRARRWVSPATVCLPTPESCVPAAPPLSHVDSRTPTALVTVVTGTPAPSAATDCLLGAPAVERVRRWSGS